MNGSRSRARAALVVAAVAAAAALAWWATRGRGGGAAHGPDPTVHSGAAPREPRPAPATPRLAPVAPSARLVLAGRVETLDGAPVAGAVVRVTSPAVEVRSDAGGGFAVPDLPAGVYAVTARTEELAATPVRVRLARGSPPVVLRVHAAGALRVRVTSAADGRPIAGAIVELRSTSLPGDVDVRHGETGDDGVLAARALPAGTWSVGAVARGHRAIELPVPPQAGLAWEVELRLPPAATVEGRVVDAAGAPVAGAVVRALPAELELVQIARPPPGRLAATSDADGAFALALDAGEHRLVATHPRHLPGASAPLAHDGRTPRRGIEIRLERGGSIAGQVTTADGRPAARAIIRANAVDPHAPGAGLAVAVAGDDGAFVLEGLPRARVEVVAATPDASSEEVAFDLAAEPDVRGAVVRLVFDEVIAGRVTDASGAPIAGAQVVCVGLPRGAIGTRPVLPETAGDDGGFACRGLAPGEYELTAMRPYANHNVSPWLRSAGAVAVTGDRGVELVVPGDGAVAGAVELADGTPARRFAVRLDPSGAPRPFDAADGRFVMDGVAPRTYDLEISAPGAAPLSIRVDVPEGGTLDLGTLRLRRAADPG